MTSEIREMWHPAEAAISPDGKIDCYVWQSSQTKSVYLCVASAAAVGVFGLPAALIALDWVGLYQLATQWWHPALVAATLAGVYGAWHFGRLAIISPMYVFGRLGAMESPDGEDDEENVFDIDSEDDPIAAIRAVAKDA